MRRCCVLIPCLLALSGAAAPPAAGGKVSPAVEKLLRAYCARHGLARNRVETWKTALAPAGCAFRYRLATVPGRGKQVPLAERYGFVFVDPRSGNVFGLKRASGGEEPTTRRTLAILTLLGTKVATSQQAEAVVQDLFRVQHWLSSVEPWDYRHDPATIAVAGDGKPPTTWHGIQHGIWMGLAVRVDAQGYVVDVWYRYLR